MPRRDGSVALPRAHRARSGLSLLGLVAQLLGCDAQGVIAGAPGSPGSPAAPCEGGTRDERCPERPVIGVPPEACGAGFSPDERGGCAPILPEEPCSPGEIAVPGDTVCRAIAPCGAAPYGDIPVDETTQHVDRSFAGDGSDGTRERPWRTVQEGIDAAAPGAIVAVAAGRYPESVVVADKPVRLWGRCPSLVEIAGPDTPPEPPPPTLGIFGPDASGAEIRAVAVTSAGGNGVTLVGARSVIVDRIWIHDTRALGMEVWDGHASASVAMRGSLVERNGAEGVVFQSSEATFEASAIRDTQWYAFSFYGEGTPQDISTRVMRGSLIERGRFIGIALFAAALIETTVVRDTQLNDGGDYGVGVWIQDTNDRLPGTVATVRGCLVEKNRFAGVHVVNSTAVIDASVVRETEADDDGRFGYGVAVEPLDEPVADSPGVTINASLIEKNQSVGLYVYANTAVTSSIIRETRTDKKARFGDGIFSHSIDPERPTRTTVTSAQVESNARIGIFFFQSAGEVVTSEVTNNLVGIVASESPELRLDENLVSGNVQRDQVTSGELPVPSVPPSIP